MRVLTPHFIAQKTVLLRLDLDVPLKKTASGMAVAEDYRLRAALPTLYLCLQYASKVIVMGHIGRPKGEESDLSVAPVVDWLDKEFPNDFPTDRLQVLENLRFEEGELSCSKEYAEELAKLGDCFVNEAFAAHHPAASTTILPTLIPSRAGFHFQHEVETLLDVRNNPKRPLVAIVGGAKIEDKYPAIQALSKLADTVLVGGKLSRDIVSQGLKVDNNVFLAKLNKEGVDISEADYEHFSGAIKGAKQIIWGGPLGKYEDPTGSKGTMRVAEAVIKSGAQTILGGGDSVAALSFYLDKFDFVSTGGGAMLKLLSEGTLPTIKALQ